MLDNFVVTRNSNRIVRYATRMADSALVSFRFVLLLFIFTLLRDRVLTNN